MEINKTACFSGHRPEKFNFPLTVEYPEYVRLLETTKAAILEAIDDGYEHFMVGMAGGFDLIAASMFYELKEAQLISKNIRLTAVLPFNGHRPTKDWQTIHQAVLDKADEVITVADKYSSRAYLERNRLMVDRSSRLICYCASLTGGTAYTVKYAARNGLKIVNLAELEPGNDLLFFLTHC